MAEIAAQPVKLDTRDDVVMVTWPNFKDGDTATPYETPSRADRSVQMVGDFDGNTIAIQGSNEDDPETGVFATLTDPQGNPLTFTAEKIESVTELTRWIKPVNTAGAGAAQDVTIILLARRELR